MAAKTTDRPDACARMMHHRFKPLWSWQVYSFNARDVLWLVLPLLVTKRALAEEAVGGGDAL